jgi:hypothetical protein
VIARLKPLRGQILRALVELALKNDDKDEALQYLTEAETSLSEDPKV